MFLLVFFRGVLWGAEATQLHSGLPPASVLWNPARRNLGTVMVLVLGCRYKASPT